MVSSSHIPILDSDLNNVQIGIILEEGGRLLDMDFAISNFSQWGIQVETWNQVEFPGIEFSPGATAISSICMVGRIQITAKGPSGEIIEGADNRDQFHSGKAHRIDHRDTWFDLGFS